MEKIITIIYSLGLIGSSIWRYRETKGLRALVIEVLAGVVFITVAISMGSSDLKTSFLSYYLALGIGLFLVIFFAIRFRQNLTAYSLIQLLVSLIYLIAGLYFTYSIVPLSYWLIL
jgi:hypothetical protein